MVPVVMTRGRETCGEFDPTGEPLIGQSYVREVLDMCKTSFLTGLLCVTLSGWSFGQTPKAGNPPRPREFPGLKQTQLAMTLEEDQSESHFRATAVAKGEGVLRI